MAFTKFLTSVANIAGLGDKPNTDDALTPSQLKAKFDKGATDIASYLNNTLTVQIDTDLATKAELAGAVLGGISDDSITNGKLATDVKIGSLASLNTTAKTSVTAAINETEASIGTLDATNGVKFYGKVSQMSGGSAKSGLNASVFTFSTEDIDNFSAINLGTSTSRITIPSGINRARFFFIGGVTAYPKPKVISLRKNGTLIMTVSTNFDGGGEIMTPCATFPPITVSVNDYFEMYYDSSTVNTSVGAGSIFGMEVLS